MIVVQKECYDSPMDAQLAAFTSPDPRHIGNADSVSGGVDLAKTFIEDTGYKGNVEVLDYTPYTFCTTAKRIYFKMVMQSVEGIIVIDHPDA